MLIFLCEAVGILKADQAITMPDICEERPYMHIVSLPIDCPNHGQDSSIFVFGQIKLVFRAHGGKWLDEDIADKDV